MWSHLLSKISPLYGNSQQKVTALERAHAHLTISKLRGRSLIFKNLANAWLCTWSTVQSWYYIIVIINTSQVYNEGGAVAVLLIYRLKRRRSTKVAQSASWWATGHHLKSVSHCFILIVIIPSSQFGSCFQVFVISSVWGSVFILHPRCHQSSSQ